MRRLLDETYGGIFERVLKQQKFLEEATQLSGLTKIAQGIASQGLFAGRDLTTSIGLSRELQERIATAHEALSAHSIPSQYLAKSMYQENLANGILAEHLREIMVPMGSVEAHLLRHRALEGAFRYNSDTVAGVLKGLSPLNGLSANLQTTSELAKTFAGIADQIRQFSSVDFSRLTEDQKFLDAVGETYWLADSSNASDVFRSIGLELETASSRGLTLTPRQIVEIISFLMSLISFIALFIGAGDYTESDRRRDEQTAVTVGRIEARQKLVDLQAQVAMALSLAQAAHLDAMPKAFVRTGANVRAEPKRTATRIARLGQDANVAVAGKEGRWLLIVFSDPLAGDLKTGWVWASSLDMIEGS